MYFFAIKKPLKKAFQHISLNYLSFDIFSGSKTMIQPLLDKLHLEQINRKLDFEVGDTVKVHYKIKEGSKERIQVYEGTVIAIRNRGVGKSIVVRRISFDVGVERVFPIYAPTVEKIEKMRSSKVRRSKLYFLRDKIGKGGRLKEVKSEPPVDKVFAKAEEIKAETKKAAAAAAPAEEANAEAQATPEAAEAPTTKETKK
ncbi:MAG: 50S ribosomal protein L19 [Leptospirales bacterium]